MPDDEVGAGVVEREALFIDPFRPEEAVPTSLPLLEVGDGEVLLGPDIPSLRSDPVMPDFDPASELKGVGEEATEES